MTDKQFRASHTIPATAGIGLRAQHYKEVLEQRPDTGWFEVHSENYFGDGGRPHYYLNKIRQDYPLSLHGVGLSIGSADELNQAHLKKLRTLIGRYEPGLVSEHLSWSHVGGRYNNDLIPVPYSEPALQHIITKVEQVQERIGRQLLIENVSSYLQYTSSTIPEDEFINEVANRSGCGILLDINNIYVNARNHGIDADNYLQTISTDHVHEMHLAGHTVKQLDDGELLIDTHDNLICDAVWALYSKAVETFPQVPVLIEWDSDIPELNVLLSEAGKAQTRMGYYDEYTTRIANRV